MHDQHPAAPAAHAGHQPAEHVAFAFPAEHAT
jgi:hypothetical protein